MDARCNVRGEDSCSSTGSYNSYSTFPNVDDSEVLSDDDNRSGGGGEGRKEKLVQESVSLENNAASTANLAYGRSSASHNSISGSSPVSVKEDEDSSMGDEDNNSCSDFSMDDCDITIVDDTSFKKPQNEAEIMFLQVVEILRYEKKVCFRMVLWCVNKKVTLCYI